MLSEIDKIQYEKIFAQLKLESANIFTRKECADHLGISKRTFDKFINLHIHNCEYLSQYAAILGYDFIIKIEKQHLPSCLGSDISEELTPESDELVF